MTNLSRVVKLVDQLVQKGIDTTAALNDPTIRYYHNGPHAQMVHDYYVLIAQLALKNKQITFDDFQVGRGAASYHDVVQGKGGGTNERLSADELQEAMLWYEIFNAWHIFTGRQSVIGTTVFFDAQGVMHQQAENIDLYTAKLVADADLGSLGASKNVYIQTAKAIIMEMAGHTDLTQEEWRAGWSKQVKLLTGRKFLTAEANQLWGANLQRNLKVSIQKASI